MCVCMYVLFPASYTLNVLLNNENIEQDKDAVTDINNFNNDKIRCSVSFLAIYQQFLFNGAQGQR